MDLEEVSESEYIITIKGVDSDFKAFFHAILGTFEKSLEYGGEKGLKVEFIDKSWEGSPAARIRFSWVS